MPPPTRSQLQAEIDDLRSKLNPLDAPHAIDPDMTGIEVDNTPAIAAPTNDPHRITLVVPTPDETVVSLGKAGPANRIIDTGITGRTKTHIHWHAKDEPQTMVLLGNKTNEGWAGYKANQLALATGYMMVTEGASWSDSKEQMYLVSRERDVILRAASPEEKKVLVQSDTGSVWVGGGEGVIVGGKNEVVIYANTGFAKSDAPYKGIVSPELKQVHEKGWLEWTTTGFDWAQTVIGVIGGVVSSVIELRKPDPEKKGWKRAPMTEFASMVLEIGKLAYAVKKGFQAHETPGSVSIHAEHEIGIAAGGVFEAFGQRGAAISSPLTVDLIGLTVGAKAATFASLWGGLSASVVSAKEATVAAREVKIKAKKEVNITSAKEVNIGGDESVVISAMEKHAVVFGKEWVYVAAEGYGMKAKEHELAIGKMSSPSNYKSAKIDDSSMMKMEDSKITIKNSGGAVELVSGNVKVSNKDGTAVWLNGGLLSISADNIHLN